MGFDLEGADPLCIQLADELERRIRTGVYAPGRRIPSASDLCEEFSVSRQTSNSALKLLKERGLARGVSGRGTFVVDDVPEPS
ncbi:GntR family transcriptional regulator [Actinomadura sp.]|jgi:DNA-binding GntR family transcriptional regulator|uniref:GntR family transcriptional regulator n=1 Tax=Actinomadura sp. TaxID=1989 RepID=UPI0037C806F2